MTWPATGRTRTRLACPQLEALHQSGPQQAGGRIGADHRLGCKLQGRAPLPKQGTSTLAPSAIVPATSRAFLPSGGPVRRGTCSRRPAAGRVADTNSKAYTLQSATVHQRLC